jgi:FixJ family two-component response regulator
MPLTRTIFHLLRALLPHVTVASTQSRLLEGGMPKNTLISIVDDDESVREATKGLMSSLGLSAESFACAEDFLSSSHRPHTACLIADVQMPGISGLDLYRQLLAAGAAIPTILITAYPDERVRARALKAGVSCYLVKPFKEADLLDCLRTVLGQEPKEP